ncbi:MAG: 16S rRNA (adenine(1518)-N(6)/adenine(1519)-N(6))-dimethyltransferase RsmA [Alphaproteobacteria bacterium]|nr:16S rRNA (adenine(1518)-N(6)/adenine(1519)-N(6))-dimethyltransferase RsmA [Alphaproteobacteria bacterium]
MTNLTEIIATFPSLRTTVEAHQLMADKKLGQNFLLDQNITDKIIRCSLSSQNLSDFTGAEVFEIGPGPGGLTRAILKASPDKLTVIEMDSRCISIMEEIQSKTGNILEIKNADALKYPYPQSTDKNIHIISNLPYNISVPLLINWLTSINNYKSLTLMFQKEVAERIMASIRCKDYGRISILSQLQCKITKLFDLSPECFVPAPKIWSTVLLFEPLSAPLNSKQIEKLEKLTSQAFSARRKMIRQSLKSYNNLETACEQLGIPLTSRPEELTPQQFLALSQTL